MHAAIIGAKTACSTKAAVCINGMQLIAAVREQRSRCKPCALVYGVDLKRRLKWEAGSNKFALKSRQVFRNGGTILYLIHVEIQVTEEHDVISISLSKNKTMLLFQLLWILYGISRQKNFLSVAHGWYFTENDPTQEFQSN